MWHRGLKNIFRVKESLPKLRMKVLRFASVLNWCSSASYHYLKRRPQQPSYSKTGMQKRAGPQRGLFLLLIWSVWWLFDRDTQRRACVLPESPATSCPAAVGTEPVRHRPHASSTQSTHCCPCGGAMALAPPFPSWLCTSLATGKASLAFRKFPLCVALCRCSCASRAWSGWRDAGKSVTGARSPF